MGSCSGWSTWLLGLPRGSVSQEKKAQGLALHLRDQGHNRQELPDNSCSGHRLALRVATVEGSLELLSPTTQPSSNLDPRATAVKITQRPEKTGSYLFQGLITVFFWCLTSVSCYLIEGKDAPTPWLSYSPTPCVSPVPGMTVDHLTLLGLRLCLRAALPSRVGIDPDRAVRTREPRPEAEGPGG